jgi:hypothetical protein
VPELLILIVVLGLVTYRVSRFIVLDTLWESWRDRLHAWLMSKPALWRIKLHELLGCPFCVTIWVSAGACLLTRWFVGSFAMPVWAWLGAATFALVVWEYVDAEE